MSLKLNGYKLFINLAGKFSFKKRLLETTERVMFDHSYKDKINYVKTV
jgi:hypothetical protein